MKATKQEQRELERLAALPIHERVEALIQLSGLTRQAVADASGLHRNTINSWLAEGNPRTPNVDSAVKFYSALRAHVPGLELNHVLGLKSR